MGTLEGKVAIVLHDTLEDTNTTEEELIEHFGAEVAQIIAEVTDDKSLPKEERKNRQIEHTSLLSRGAKLVKLGDKICNVRDVLHSPPKRWSIERRIQYIERRVGAAAAVHGPVPQHRRALGPR